MSSVPALSSREIWIRLLLYPSHTLPTAAAPVLVGAGLAWRDHILAPVPLLVGFLASWLIHIGGVFMDNHELLRRHPDLPEHPELLQGLQTGALSLSGLRRAILSCFVLAGLAIPYMVAIGGPLALAIGVIGAAAGYFYAGWPHQYVKVGLADPIFFVMFGVVAVAGIYYIQWAAFHPEASHGLDALRMLPPEVYLLGLPVGALVTNVMIIDDIRDRRWDARKGWHTFAVRFGLRGGRNEYFTLSVFAFAMPFAFWLGFGASPWMLLPLLTLPLARKIWQQVSTHEQTRDLLPMSPMASYLSLSYGALLGIGVALASG